MLRNSGGNRAGFPGFKAFIYATGQEIPRPKGNKKKKQYYSGKKERQTVKTQLMGNAERKILDKSEFKKGGKNDYSVYKQR